jgi:transposase
MPCQFSRLNILCNTIDNRIDKVFFNSGIVGTIKNVIVRLEMLKLAKHIKTRTNIENQVSKFKLLPGIGPIIAQTLVFECGELSRFGRPDQVSRFLELTPGMQHGGNSSPVLAITKEGNEFSRRMVISASKF